ncbi:MAG: hypothetical protein PHQ46_06845 [Negativicutes bacterium]|nr:hypothetical protein [Negativicutes bacterium]
MPSIKPTLTVRIPPNIRQRLEEEAEKNDRSISKMLSIVLENYFELADKTKLSDVLTKAESETLDKLKSLPLIERQAIIKKLSEGN